MSFDWNQIAPCGVDCVHCDLFKANNRTEVWERAARRTGRKPEEMACLGCRANNGCVFHADCATLACARKQKVELCSDCREFPCRRLMPAADCANLVPSNLKLFNLLRIRLVGPERFLEEAPANRRLYFKGRYVVGAGPQETKESEG